MKPTPRNIATFVLLVTSAVLSGLIVSDVVESKIWIKILAVAFTVITAVKTFLPVLFGESTPPSIPQQGEDLARAQLKP